MVIGVTGNTGTGKTVICELFKERGAHLISCDELGWEVLKEPHIISQIADNFKEVIENGEVNREKLGAIVFGGKDKLKTFNEIVHPELLKKLKENIESSKKKVVVDGALIFEWRIENWFDYIILLISTLEDKKKRLIEKGLNKEIIMGRLNSQENSEKFIKYSDFIIENDGDLESLKSNARWIWDKLKKG
ncbi:dephospho-CoA kinase [candidate division WOR-3 bacterium]|nr:dephospho-CoA kinase [candidate division WOR-3 bacterium]